MNTPLGDKLLNYCVGAQHLFIVAPYIKANALTRILDAVGDIESLLCITKWDPHDLTVGVSDIECRTIVKERGGSFRLHPYLHAKYYRINDVVLIGSANLTFSAMGWSPQSNLEILSMPGKDFNVCAFQRSLLEEAREINDDEFARWEALTNIKTQRDSMTNYGRPTLDTWRPITRDPRNLDLAYRGREYEIASFDEQQAAQRDIQALQIPLGLTEDQVRIWVSVCLLAAPFTNSVIRLQDADPIGASRLLSKSHGLGSMEARRNMETVQNWLSFFTPETFERIHRTPSNG